MINTLNESHLHKTLKTIFSLENPDCAQEKAVGKYIADILTKEGDVIEIQTGSLSHLAAKILYFISQKRNITVVYPLATQKFILTRDENALPLTKRKSPLKKNIYSIFRELTALTPFLTNRYFTLIVQEVTLIEERQKTQAPIQSKNKRRRFLKNWIKTGKKLESLGERHTFRLKKSWKMLLPKKSDLPQDFTINELFSLIKQHTPSVKRQEISLMIWVYCKIGILEYKGKKGKANIYCFC